MLDTAITTTYTRAGITADNPATWTRPVPLLADLAAELREVSPAGVELAARLAPFVTGAYSGLLAGPTTTPPVGHLVTFNLRRLPEELRPLGTLLTLHTIWSQVADPHQRRPRYVHVDEGWLLLQSPAGAAFLARLAKSARKHWTGLTVATQDTSDVLSSDLGRAVIANAATQVLLRQATQAIDQVADVFALSAGERAFLMRAERGQGLLSTGVSRCAFAALASPAEHVLCTSDPRELHAAGLDAAGLDDARFDGASSSAQHAGPRWLDLDLDTPTLANPAGAGELS